MTKQCSYFTTVAAVVGTTFLSALALAAGDKANEILAVTEQKTSFRPFAFEWTSANAGLIYAGFRGAVEGFPGSSDGSTPLGFNGEVFGGIGLMLAAIPMTVLSVPADIISAPFRRRTFVKGAIKGHVVDGQGLPVMHVQVKGREFTRYSTLSGKPSFDFVVETDGTGWFEAPLKGYFYGKSDNRLIIEIMVGDSQKEFQIVRQDHTNLHVQNDAGHSIDGLLVIVKSTETKNNSVTH